MLFVHITEDCYKSAEHYGILRAKLDELKDSVEASQSDANFEKNALPFLWKKFAKFAGRLIAHKVYTKVGAESHAVIVFLQVMMYGSDDFDKKINWRPQQTFEHAYKDIADVQEYFINRLVVDRLSTVNPPDIIREKLSTEEEEFLYSAVDNSDGARNGEDDQIEANAFRVSSMICESDRWQVALNNLDLDQLWPCIRETVQSVYEECEKYGPKYEDGRAQFLEVKKIKGYSIVYQWIDRTLFLANIRGVENGKHDDLGTVPPEDSTSMERARHHVYREYPQYMLYDIRLWNELEKERYGNLSLSPEEAEILHPQQCGFPSFPLFIKGRAGSGKSTVLQYLFAEYFARYATLRYSERCSGASLGAGPAYFACNEKLIESAKKVVKSILCHNPCYSSAAEDIVRAIQQATAENGCYEGNFNIYRKFLLSLLPVEVRETRFKDAGYFDYSRFENEWNRKFKGRSAGWKQRCRAESSWYIIRTFIKGASPNGFLENVDVLRSCLEREGKDLAWAVQSEMYKDVYQEVWTDWYEGLVVEDERCNDTVKAWDDQDLVRYVTDHKLFKGPKYWGVFCDEAQDFTALDLHFILHTTIYPERVINRYDDLKQIPFAFAGDEFQTLNPSGFSWAQLRTSFVQMLVEGVCPQLNLSKLKADLDRQMCGLENNYRSRLDVVRFGNTVQYYRAQQFGLTDLRPQKEWRDRRGMPVACYLSTEPMFWENMHCLRGLHILVPCQENEELKYLDEHPDLGSHVVRNPDGTTSPIVLSAMQAKGLEYPCVAVYGFGDYWSKSQKQFEGETDGAKRLTLSYFTNKLYVAVTRAQDQLVILDTERGLNGLWNSFMDLKVLCVTSKCEKSVDGKVCALCDKIEGVGVNPSVWRGHIGKLTEGLPNYLVGTGIEFDPKKMAENYLDRAEIEKDPKFMRLAANFFDQCQDDEGAGRLASKCRAKALMYEKKYEEAAEQLKSLGDIPGACECWWQSSSDCRWDKISALSYQIRQDNVANKERMLISRACSSGKIDVLRAALDAVLYARRMGQLDDFGSRSWTSALDVAVQRMLSSPDYASTEDGTRLERLANLGISISNAAIKELRFKATSFPENLLYFDEEDLDQSRMMVKGFRNAGPGQWSIWGGPERDGGLDPDRQHKLVNAFKCVVNNTEDKKEKRACARAMEILLIRQKRRGTAFNDISEKYEAIQRRCGEKFPYRLLAYASENCVVRFDEEPQFEPMVLKLRDYLKKNGKDAGSIIGEGLTANEFGVALRWIIGDRKEATRDLRVRYLQYYEMGRRHLNLEWENLLKEVLDSRYFVDIEPEAQSIGAEEHLGANEKHGDTDILAVKMSAQENAQQSDLQPENSVDDSASLISIAHVAGDVPANMSIARETAGEANIDDDALRLRLGSFDATYFREARALDFDVNGKRWTIEEGCIKVNRKRRPELCDQDVFLEGTPFVLCCSKDKAVLKDSVSGVRVEFPFG